MAVKEFKAVKEAAALGEIAADRVYPLQVFCRLQGLSDRAMRGARRRGLKLRVVGRRRYVVGAEWLRFLQSSADAE